MNIHFKDYLILSESLISASEIKAVEKFADRLFLKLGLDVKFTKHFKERLYDKRNGKPISKIELISLFTRTFNQYKTSIASMEIADQAVITDILNKLNLPFVISTEKGQMQLVSKTIMRKKDFKTPNTRLVVT